MPRRRVSSCGGSGPPASGASDSCARSLPAPNLRWRAGRSGPGVSGTEYLSRRREALHREENLTRPPRRSAERLQDVLAGHVTESLRRGGSPGSSLLLDMAYLVPTETEAGFLGQVQHLTEALEPRGLSLEVTGPWPPYSFVTLTPEGSDGA